MQYFGRAIGSVSKTWNSINPATLSGAIDVIVVEDEEGEMRCSPFHVRFGKFQLLRPSQKKVSVIVNGEITDIPMKLSDEGEAFFVFETDGYVPEYLQTSPVVSARSSPSSSPRLSPSSAGTNDELEYLDIGEGANDTTNVTVEDKNKIIRNYADKSSLESREHDERYSRNGSMSPIERARSITMKLNIPSKVEANGDILLDMHGYKSDKKDIKETDALVRQLLQEEFGDDFDTANMLNTDLEGNIRIVNTEGISSESAFTSGFLEPEASSSATSIPTSPSRGENAYDEGQGETPSPVIKNDQAKGDAISQNPSAVSIHVPSSSPTSTSSADSDVHHDVHYKTLRLTSEQLKCLSLNYGENDIKYNVNNGKSIVTCKLYLWKRSTPIVISDIDGTITRSDALGHVLTMLGRDWTHEGVAKLFDDIEFNGYNIMYLTARSVGLADTTRAYLRGVEQNDIKLPMGPVILSPDRTIAALKREIVLKKPEVFKMSCLNDIRTLYYPEKTNPLEHDQKHLFENYEDDVSSGDESGRVATGGTTGSGISYNRDEYKLRTGDIDGTNGDHDDEGSEFTDLNTSTDPSKVSDDLMMKFEDMQLKSVVDESSTPFYAGFGNRITDAISYRSVGVPSSRIFTINPDGDVKMELLEMAGYKSSYVSIVELVDQFFPPVDIRQTERSKDNIENEKPLPGSLQMSMSNAKNKYTDFTYWRNPNIDLSLITDDEDESGDGHEGAEDGDDKGKGRKSIEIGGNSDKLAMKGLEEIPNIKLVSDGRPSSKEKADEDTTSRTNKSSRFSFFLRSPLSSPAKQEGDGRNDAANDANITDRVHTEVNRRLADELHSSGNIPATGSGGEDIGEGEEPEELDEPEEPYSEEEESDSDYIYETSGDEDEDEDEEEDEDEHDEEDHDESAVPVPMPMPVPAAVPITGSSSSLSLSSSSSQSFSAVSATRASGRFV